MGQCVFMILLLALPFTRDFLSGQCIDFLNDETVFRKDMTMVSEVTLQCRCECCSQSYSVSEDPVQGDLLKLTVKNGYQFPGDRVLQLNR